MTFVSQNSHVVLDVVLRRTTSCNDVISSTNERRTRLEIPEDIGALRFLQFDNSYHEAIIRIPRLQCKFMHASDRPFVRIILPFGRSTFRPFYLPSFAGLLI